MQDSYRRLTELQRRADQEIFELRKNLDELQVFIFMFIFNFFSVWNLYTWVFCMRALFTHSLKMNQTLASSQISSRFFSVYA